ncbi:MAG: hypothetical protein CVU74_00050 [Deltaproteobacteria bacterium HGW-Deltaproteobacteria-9]|nr:MAG: hypothetical protein CVU74_00050 [Deltaproteobacteria bacterium HGW-Deltaproteobacteria-9]
MDADKMRTLTLGISARTTYLPVVTSFVESAAIVFGMKKEEYLRLALATEEIFLYLSNFVCPGKSLDVQCFNGFYYTRVLFRFSAVEMNLSGLNIASTITPDREPDLDAMGLLIASRSVDHLNIIVEKNNRICLTITKEKTYPESSEKLPLPQSTDKIFAEAPDAERLKIFATLTAQTYDLSQRPSFFTYPGKLVDMVESGEFSAIVALNQKKEVLGGIVYFYRTEKNVQCFGPYCFAPEQEKMICETLLSACLGNIGRTRALGLLSLSGLPVSIRSNFEALGSLRYTEEGKLPVDQLSFYRLLHEDPGFEVWSTGDLTNYLQREYSRLALAREIRTVRNMGETRSGASLFAAEVHRDRQAVTMRPIWPGDDYSANIERHVRYLSSDNFLNLYFELDLGVPWQAELIPLLMAQEFKPGIILPFAGKSDIVIFEYNNETKS